MVIETQKIEIDQLITQYADAVNTSNAPAIAALYAKDGLLMPEGFKSIIGSGVNGGHFKKKSITIEYAARDIVIDGDFAFVETRATTKTTDPSTKQDQVKATRDLFVLKKITGNWKIYRYIFNKEHQY